MIPEDWEVRELGELLQTKGYIRGPFGSALRRPELKSEGIPVYEQANAIYNHRDFRFFIDENRSKELKRFTVKENDLIISCSGTFGKVSIIKIDDPKGIISQALLILRPETQKVNPHYLKYFFISDKGYQSIASRSLGSVQVNIAKREVIEKIELAIPKDRNEQDIIVKILSDLDSKIELNQQMNKTLEAMGQALFKHWFMDFEFPNEKSKPYKSSGGKMIDSELGEIPRGWKVGDLIDVAEIIMGQSPPGESYNETGDGIPFYQGNRDFGFRYPSNRVFCISPTRFAKEEDILLSVRAPVGELNVAVEKCAIGRGVCAIRMRNFSNSFLFYFLKLKTDLWDNFNSEGTVFGCLNKTELHKIKIVVPADAYLKTYDKIMVSIENQILNNEIQNRQLLQIRDSLLPRLMLGKIRVKV